MADVHDISEARPVGWVAKELQAYVKEHSPDKVMCIMWHAATEESPECCSIMWGGTTSYIEQLGILSLAKQCVTDE